MFGLPLLPADVVDFPFVVRVFGEPAIGEEEVEFVGCHGFAIDCGLKRGAVSIVGKSSEEFLQPGERLDLVGLRAAHERVHDGGSLAAFCTPNEQVVLASDRRKFHKPFRSVIVEEQVTPFRVSAESVLRVGRVGEGGSHWTLGKDAAIVLLGFQPGFELVHDR